MSEVSIAMATYNGAKYIREQLDSLYSQTKVPDEIVVCDDGSKDGTADILEEYHQKFGLKYYVNESNLGVNKNFEKAIRLCTKPYVAICDQDDVWFPRKIEVLLQKMMEVENGQPCAVSSKTTLFAGTLDKFNYVQVEKDSVGAAATLLRAGNVQGCTLMLNRRMIDVLKPFPASYKDVMMYDGYISFVAATCGIKYNIGQTLMAYRHHDSNVLAKIQVEKSLLTRIFRKLRTLKYDRMFPSRRCFTLKCIYDEYFDLMHEDAKKIIEKIVAYGKGGLFTRIKFIMSINDFGLKFKINNVLLELVMFFIPIKNTSRR